MKADRILALGVPGSPVAIKPLSMQLSARARSMISGMLFDPRTADNAPESHPGSMHIAMTLESFSDNAQKMAGSNEGMESSDPSGLTARVAESRLPKRHPNTGIDVLIVGAGMGGLMSALECWRKGHNVIGILERNDGPAYSGDIIVIQPSAVSVFRHWPDLMEDLDREQVDAGVSYEKHSGEHIYGPTVPNFNEPQHLSSRKGPKLVAPAQIRQKFFAMLLRQVSKLGIEVEYGKRVNQYFEDSIAGKGGVIIEGGKIRIGDIVIAADGLRSNSEVLIFGEHMPTRSSGMSIYRMSWPKHQAMENELVRKRWGTSPPMWEYWLGPGMYIGIFVSDEIIAFGFTPRDIQGKPATESWEPDTQPEDVIKELNRAPDWDPAILALVSMAPRTGIVHWPLLWRDLRRQWTSPGGRVVQVGDSAHSFTPTSGNGATQAIEDAITLAACLELGGGARNAPVAAKIYNLLRFERVSCAQKMSFVNSQLKTETDWDVIWSDPSKVKTRFPKWVWSHDPEEYAYEKYGQAYAHLLAGESFHNTNYPRGHHFQPWTVEEIQQQMQGGKRVEDLLDGDWT